MIHLPQQTLTMLDHIQVELGVIVQVLGQLDAEQMASQGRGNPVLSYSCADTS